MFETVVQEELGGRRWGIISACVALVVLLVVGYMLIA
jgi:hypothetical protein